MIPAAKLESLTRRFAEVEQLLCDPKTHTHPHAYTTSKHKPAHHNTHTEAFGTWTDLTKQIAEEKTRKSYSDAFSKIDAQLSGGSNLAEVAKSLGAEVKQTPSLTADGQVYMKPGETMPAELQLHYAMKANPYGPLLGHMAAMVDGLDVASGGELKAVRTSGMATGHISFAGPGKRDSELEYAIKAGATLNLESAGEMERALGAQRRGRRVHPGQRQRRQSLGTAAVGRPRAPAHKIY